MIEILLNKQEMKMIRLLIAAMLVLGPSLELFASCPTTKGPVVIRLVDGAGYSGNITFTFPNGSCREDRYWHFTQASCASNILGIATLHDNTTGLDVFITGFMGSNCSEPVHLVGGHSYTASFDYTISSETCAPGTVQLEFKIC